MSKLVFCPTCNKDVLPIVKMFNAKICPLCSKVLSSDIPIESGSI